MEHRYVGTVQLPFPESESVLVSAEETLEETQVHTRTHRCEYKVGSLSTRRTRLPQNKISCQRDLQIVPTILHQKKKWNEKKWNVECSTSSSTRPTKEHSISQKNHKY
jgi:hypothetical protein